MELVAESTITAIPAFADNYIWMIHKGRDAIVVDPGDARPVQQALAALSLRLVGILVTHHHSDHVDGIAALREQLHGPVYGPAAEAIPAPFSGLAEGDSVTLLGLNFSVMEVPGHTAGHIAYYADQPDEAPLLFCGDTLFSGGCGRLFEGTAAQMLASLQKLAALPEATRVFCTHEYTLSNLRFAREIEPDNQALADYQAWAQRQRSQDRPTLPASLGLEKQINPFLRCSEATVAAAAARLAPASTERLSPLATFSRLRQWKNDYR